MIKKINQSPTTEDRIVFDLETPGVNGLLTQDPLSIETVTIYYIERDFAKINDKAYEITHYDPALKTQVEDARKLVHEIPSPENLEKLNIAKTRLDAAVIKHKYYFADAKMIYSLGNAESPAFNVENPMASPIKAVVFDEKNSEQFGRFVFEWDANGNKEGDYFISWSWIMEEDQSPLITHQMFRLSTPQRKNTYMPMRYTQDKKYETLLDRYTPSMYKHKITNKDLTPWVLGRLNLCVAKGFTEIEDMANQLMDVYDTNTTKESVLQLLANMFNLKLKSNDPTLWRRQVRQAVPLFKKKGTLAGLKEALDQAGIKMTKLTKLWQIVSEYTQIDGFVKTGVNALIGNLSKIPYDLTKIKIQLKSADKEEYLSIPEEYWKLNKTESGDFSLLWLGELAAEPISLYEGDVILVWYQIKPVPADWQTVENYIMSLPLSDSRNPAGQKYPLKNWNTRLIEEDDPLFDVIIKERHPHYDPVSYGKVRTKFLYSEKVYNMDTYNGSLRDSKNPCDIDKDFMDNCSYCQSGKFNIDIEIEDLCNDRIDEAKVIITEYMPFHAVLHSININGCINEFIVSPAESIQMLTNVVAGRSCGEEIVNQKEEISYKIEYIDGSVEQVGVNI